LAMFVRTRPSRARRTNLTQLGAIGYDDEVNREAVTGYIDFVLPGSRELWRPLEASGFFGPPDGVGARCDDQDIFGHMREVAAVSDGLPAQ